MCSKKRPQILFSLLVILILIFVSSASAQDTPPDCPRGQGYWQNTANWPVTELILGGQVYTQAELLIILYTPADGDASLILGHQLIAAKLNAAAGTDSVVVNETIAQADAILAAYTGKLPYGVVPASAEGQTMTGFGNALNVYNNGGLSTGCSPTATPSPTPGPSPTPLPEATEEPGDDDDDVIIVIEGPVGAINGNNITIYNFNIVVNVDDPVLMVIRIGDVIRVEGDIVVDDDDLDDGDIVDDDDDDGGVTIINQITIIAINITIINADVVIIDDNRVWRDEGDCRNPPPPWAPAHGWRRRCEGGGQSSGSGGSRS